MNEPVLELSTRRLRSNLDTLRGRLGETDLVMVGKDDAYGHGVEWAFSAGAAAGVRWFGGYDIPTALRIRDVVGPAPRVLAWATSADDEVAAALTAGLDLGVGTVDYLRRVCAIAARCGRRARVHLKIDTGLHRNGVLAAEWPDAVARAVRADQAGLIRLVGAWSHLSEASDAEDDASAERFDDAVSVASGLGAHFEVTHLTASAASLARERLRRTLARVGAFCYGIRSADAPQPEGLTPVATLVVPVVEVGEDRVVLGIGTAHGLPQSLAGRFAVGHDHGTAPVETVRLTHSVARAWPGVRVGDEVAVFGTGTRNELTATDLAERIPTIGEELLTRLTPAVRRRVID